MAQQNSLKRIQIDKANATVVGFVAVASFIVAFSLVASRALLNQRAYQARVITEKSKALKQLQANTAASEKLVAAYNAFEQEPVNIIGGAASGQGDHDGDNARIVLDALPSKYDFPALATSLEKLFNISGVGIQSISGTDDEINQSTKTASAAAIDIPFTASVTANFDTAQKFIDSLAHSIRPIVLSRIDISGTDSTLTINISAKTFYQPEKTLGITTKVVK